MEEMELFVRECHRRHDNIDTKLDAIASKLDGITSPLNARMESVERLVWWQRIILVLAGLVVSYHPIASALAARVVHHP